VPEVDICENLLEAQVIVSVKGITFHELEIRHYICQVICLFIILFHFFFSIILTFSYSFVDS